MTKTVSFPVINLKGTGSNIESCRREAGLSVRDLQDYFGFEYPQAIYKWQHGECLPTVDNLLALSRILEVKMEDLLVYEDQEVSFCAISRQAHLVLARRCIWRPTVNRVGASYSIMCVRWLLDAAAITARACGRALRSQPGPVIVHEEKAGHDHA